jgi:uncharacterized protein (TIGR02246 family)
MHPDDQSIRDLVHTWVTASAAGDLDGVLALMADDVLFHTPGREPFGKEAFAAAARASAGKVRFEGTADVQEVQVSGDLAFCRVRLNISARTPEGAELKRLSGHALSVWRRQGGRWVIARDANLVTPQTQVHAAVPVFQVSSVARSAAWYRDVLGFTADPFGPPDDPVFAILRRDGVELMLQKQCGDARPRHSGLGISAYIRVRDVRQVREAVSARVPDVKPVVTREYGAQEFDLTDPDGHVLVLGQCG